MKHPATPDGRYFVHNGRLWRCTNPALPADVKERLVKELMAARRAVKAALRSGSAEDLRAARAAVHHAKVELGERGPVWWEDDTDYNRCLVENTPYADWWREHSDRT